MCLGPSLYQGSSDPLSFKPGTGGKLSLFSFLKVSELPSIEQLIFVAQGFSFSACFPLDPRSKNSVVLTSWFFLLFLHHQIPNQTNWAILPLTQDKMHIPPLHFFFLRCSYRNKMPWDKQWSFSFRTEEEKRDWIQVIQYCVSSYKLLCLLFIKCICIATQFTHSDLFVPTNKKTKEEFRYCYNYITFLVQILLFIFFLNLEEGEGEIFILISTWLGIILDTCFSISIILTCVDFNSKNFPTSMLAQK